MSIEEQVRTTLERRAATVELSPDAWERIRERAERRRWWPAFATAVAAATTVAVVTVVISAGSGERPERVATGPVTESSVPVTTTPSTATLVGAQLRIDGLGPIAIGMSFDEARRLAGLPLRLEDGPYCDSLVPDGDLRGLTLTDTPDAGGPASVDLIFVNTPAVTTISGIRVGSSVDEVRQAYAGQLETFGEVASGRYWLLYRASDPALREYGLRLNILNGRVRGMVAGLGVVTDEFCA